MHRTRISWLTVSLSVLLILSSLAGFAQPGVMAQSTSPLIVNDASTANDQLVAVPLESLDGEQSPGEQLMLPPGSRASVVASGLLGPHFMTFDPAGNLLVADQQLDAVFRYTADASTVIVPAGSPPAPLIDGLDRPSSLALQEIDGTLYLYVGEQSQISRFTYAQDGALGAQETVVPNLPTGGHRTRTVAFGPDGLLYVATGSSCNICVEDDPRRATIMRYNPDGTGEEQFATGLRNAVGLAFQPGTDSLWATVNERDHQGNEIPPDLVTTVAPGMNYGWPDCLPPDATPQQSGNDCSGVTPPTIGIQAHSAPLGLAFATGEQFPADYQGGLFVVQHGSWNREPPSPPKLMYVTFVDGEPIAVSDFATGWQFDDGTRWGRPAGIIVAPDGSLIVSDDRAGVLYRISYQAP